MPWQGISNPLQSISYLLFYYSLLYSIVTLNLAKLPLFLHTQVYKDLLPWIPQTPGYVAGRQEEGKGYREREGETVKMKKRRMKRKEKRIINRGKEGKEEKFQKFLLLKLF